MSGSAHPSDTGAAAASRSVASGESIRCPACGAAEWQPWLRAAEMFDGELFALERCRSCGLGRTADTLTPADLAGYYHYPSGADAGSRFGAVLEPLMRRLREARVAAVLRACPDGRRILDVGCGRGVMLQQLAQRGWDVWGTEIDEQVAASARSALGERVRSVAIEELDFEPGSFDVVSFWHVLEHLPDPHAALARARQLICDGGAVLVGVPNIDSWQARLSGRHWLHLDVPRHRWHFSTATLTQLASRVGLRVASVEHFSLEYGPYGLFQSLLSAAGLGHLLFTDVLRPGRRRELLRKPKAWAHLLLAAPIALAAAASLPIEAGAAALGRGGAILATLRRA